MTRDNYWTRKMRISRRRALGWSAAGGAGLAGLALVGCGDDDDDGGTPAPTPTAGAGETPTGVPTPSAGEPQSGGTFISAMNAFPATLDPYSTSDTQTRTPWAGHVYSKLIQPRGVPPGPEFPSPEFVEDLAEQWETPDEGLSYVFTLNQRAAWHPPLERPVVADDIVFAWERFSGTSAEGTPAVNTEQLEMIESVEATDEHTVVITLNAPNALFLFRMADDYVLPIMPPEVETTIDPTATGVGSGAWIVDALTPPTGFVYRRNPDWHIGPERPYLDTREYVVADTATALNQYRAGNLDTLNATNRDIAALTRDIDDLQVRLGSAGTAMPYVAFSSLNPEDPWNTDHRIRQALSMSIDRDTLFQAFHPSNEYQQAGVDVPPTLWHNVVPVGLGPEWVDPSDHPSYQYDPEGARELLREAGYPDGISAPYHYTTAYGPAFSQHAELLVQMVADGGFNLQLEIDDFQTVFIPRTFLRGDFDGFAQIYQGYGTALEWFNGMYIPGASRNQGHIDDPELTTQIQDLNQELDADARNAMVEEIVEYINERMYYVPGVLGGGPNILFRRPNVHGTWEHLTARSGAGYYSASYWKES